MRVFSALAIMMLPAAALAQAKPGEDKVLANIIAGVPVSGEAPAAAPPADTGPIRRVPAGGAFEFKGIVAGVPVDLVKFPNCGAGETANCDVGKTIAGFEPYVLWVSLFKGKLSSVTIRGDALYYPVIAKAFAEKYGKPCASTVEKWKNAVGAVLDNPVTTWCFKTGKLVLKPRGESLDTFSADYDDANQPPEGKAKVDF